LESFSINTFALVAKISQDAKERMVAGNNQYTERLGVAPTQGIQIKEESGRVSDKLAKLAGTGIVQLNL
jgi:hypothetical protein